MNSQLNEYANSMFRFERLHEQWLSTCTEYCRQLFGNQLRGKVVLDYGFGRGNWSVALLRAGAAKVYSVDASEDNVARLYAYVNQHGLTDKIVPLAGNLLEKELDIKADVLWLYGVLHHIADVSSFLTRLSSLRSSPKALVYAYYYAEKTPRSFTVQFSRKLFKYQDEKQFRFDEPAFNRVARIRARDDLTAPHVAFATAEAFRELLKARGITVQRQDKDFYSFQNKVSNVEFIPHQFLGTWDTHEGVEQVHDELTMNQHDTNFLRALAEAVEALYTSIEERRRVVIGLFNTHFPPARPYSSTADLLLELALYLGNLVLVKDSSPQYSSQAKDFLHALTAKLQGRDEAPIYEFYAGSEILQKIAAGGFRL